MTAFDHDKAGWHKGTGVIGWHRLGAPMALGLALACALVGYEGNAAACGACFAAQSESTVVNDHRMALMLSKDHTILWDQISYSGNPKEFAYVIPAKPGTRLEPSKEAWFAALDASTRPIIMQPQPKGYGGGGQGGDYMGGSDYRGGGGDYGGGCCSSTTASASGAANNAGPAAADAGAGAPLGSGAREPVEVVEQNVVGPYETVTLRANEPGALQNWLVANGYAIPAIAGAIIESYVAENFDFIALRLRPGQDVRSMEPIRIVSPGADPSLPLRLMQIGAGAKVGITLWVISEGRYHTGNFPDAAIDFTKLIWDSSQQRSNYQELSQKAMATGEGRAFITEYADKPATQITGMTPQPGMLGNPGLGIAFFSTCQIDPVQPPWKEAEAGAAPDAGDPDAGADPDAGDPDAGKIDADGGAIKPPSWTPEQCDDLRVATGELHQGDVWVSRLRANLPREALAATLRLEAAPDQSKLDNVHYAQSSGTFTPGARIAHTGPLGKHGTYALIAATAYAVSRLLRRKKREPNP